MSNFDEDKKIYLTSSIFFYGNKMYYEDDTCEENTKYIKLTTRNWVKYLDEYGWEDINDGWVKRLGNKKYCRYGIIDCGANGDCLFHCISEALNKPYDPNETLYDFQDIRDIAANQINDDNFTFILENYKLLKSSNDFDGYWDPEDIENTDELKDVIKEPGDSFWGDHIMIQLLQEALDTNIILMNSDKEFMWSEETDLPLEERFNIHPMAHNINKHPRTILLYYIDGLHFMLVGYFNGKCMKTIFDTDKLPKDFLKVYKKDCKFSF